LLIGTRSLKEAGDIFHLFIKENISIWNSTNPAEIVNLYRKSDGWFSEERGAIFYAARLNTKKKASN